MGWVILLASELEDYFNYFREGGGEFQELGHCPLLTFYGWPQNCHGVGGRVVSMLMYQVRLKGPQKPHPVPSWTLWALASFLASSGLSKLPW